MSAKHPLLLDIVRCNQRCIAETGDIDTSKVAAIIGRAYAQDPQAVVMVLADFISAALTGNVIRP